MENFEWLEMISDMNKIRLFSRTLIQRGSSEHIKSTQELDLLSQLVIHEEGLTPIKLSKAMCLNKTIVSRLIDALSKSGYIVKNPDMNDKRSYSVSITKQGREELAQIYKNYLSPIYKLRMKLGEEKFFELISNIEYANEVMKQEKGDV